MNKIQVNVTTKVVNSKIRKEVRNGREVIVIPSATLPDNVVMNKIRYPAEEIEKSYKSLNNTAAPLGHPKVNGKFVSAHAPEGMVLGFVGAWNENARRENGRVLVDKVIDVEYANQLEGGRQVLKAIEAEEPIHTSTGLLCQLEQLDSAGDDGATSIARNIIFDHDAILLNEVGAATPEQGVGIFVNSSEDDDEEIEVINSYLDTVEEDLDWAGMRLLDTLDRLEKLGKWEKLKSAIMALPMVRKTQQNTKETDMADEKQLNELSERLNKVEETVTKGLEDLSKSLGEMVSNAVKPLTDNLTELQNTQKAKDDAEKAELVNKVVKANMLTEESAKEMPLSALRELANKAKPTGTAAPIANGLFTGNGETDEFKDYDLNAGMDDK